MRRFWRTAFLAALGAAAGCTATLEEARQIALSYSKWLPDLVCTEVVHRNTDWGSGKWTPAGTLKAQVTYFQRKESYKLISPAGRKLENTAGAISEGEFGSLLRWIFEPEAKAEFEPAGTGRLRRRPVTIFEYRVDEKTSRMQLRALAHSAFVAFHGLVWVDDATGMVLRLTAEAAGPNEFPIRESYIEIEYDWATIGDKQFLVPSRAETRMTERAIRRSPPPQSLAGNTPGSCISCEPPGRPEFAKDSEPGVETDTKYRNLIEFRDYRKFTADSTVKFQ